MTIDVAAQGAVDCEKEAVRRFWNRAACGEELYLKGNSAREQFEWQAKQRYLLEPYIEKFADFASAKDKTVLEIGVGLGADHQRWAEHAQELHGIDLTDRAIHYTRGRLALFGLSSQLQVADAEALPYDDNSFDIVYSWGVLHHSPRTDQAIREVYRVLKPGGIAKVMIYHRYSLVGYMLWIRYALFRGHPFLSLRHVYANYLESPGTKAFSAAETRTMFEEFQETAIETVLTHGDLLTSSAGQRHGGVALTVARSIWPRAFFRRFLPKHGLFMLIRAEK